MSTIFPYFLVEWYFGFLRKNATPRVFIFHKKGRLHHTHTKCFAQDLIKRIYAVFKIGGDIEEWPAKQHEVDVINPNRRILTIYTSSMAPHKIGSPPAFLCREIRSFTKNAERNSGQNGSCNNVRKKIKINHLFGDSLYNNFMFIVVFPQFDSLTLR